MTSSPSPIPNTRKANSNAAVAEFKQTVLSVPKYAANCLSNSFVFGPVVSQPDLSTSVTNSISLLLISGGENGIFLIMSFNLRMFIYYLKTANTVCSITFIS